MPDKLNTAIIWYTKQNKHFYTVVH